MTGNSSGLWTIDRLWGIVGFGSTAFVRLSGMLRGEVAQGVWERSGLVWAWLKVEAVTVGGGLPARSEGKGTMYWGDLAGNVVVSTLGRADWAQVMRSLLRGWSSSSLLLWLTSMGMGSSGA